MTKVYQLSQPDPARLAHIRVKAVGLIHRDNEILLEEIHNKEGTLIGYRPVGGHIEFGEKSWEALEREFMEELGEDIKIVKLHSVAENIFTWSGYPGHEIIFVYEATLLNKDTYAENVIERMDISNEGKIKKALWLDPLHLPGGLPLFPSALLEKLQVKS